jgi:2-deoxy-D-gluconate 3-dehydrogenase
MSPLPQLFDLSGRVAIVTGGVGLLGSEFCRTLAEAGAAVMIADMNGEAANNLAASLTQIGYRTVSHETDVTSAVSVKKLVLETIKAFGRLDILVNSAALDPKFDPQSSTSHS